MLDREQLDKYLPNGRPLQQLAEKIVGLNFVDGDKVLTLGLRWLAEFMEKDSWPETPEWAKQSHEWIWPITINGLCYKGNGSYLTAEGWPLGTQCWYVRIECGHNVFATAETPELAVLRAIVIVGVFARCRLVPPDQRLALMLEAETMMKEFM